MGKTLILVTLQKNMQNTEIFTRESFMIGTGTGVIPFNLFEYGADIKAIDISENQILVAKEIANERNIKNIEFIVSGAEKTHFADNSFDCITAAQCF